MNDMKKIFIHFHLIPTFCFIIIQQAIVASSTLWLAKLFEAVSNKTYFTDYLIFFLTSLIIPYLPAYLSIVSLIRWKQAIFKNLVNTYVYSNSFSPSNWIGNSTKDKRLPFFCNESFRVAEQLLYFLFDAVSTSLNVFLNILMVAIVIDSAFIIAYVCSLSVSFLSIFFTKNYIQNASSEAQDSRVSLTNILLKAWDNLVLSNSYNALLWKNAKDEAYENSARKDIQLNRLTYGVSESVSALTVLPVLAVLIYSVIQNINNYTYLAVLFSSLPRQLMILNHLYVVTSYFAKYHQISAEIDGLFEILVPLTPIDLDSRISWAQISLNKGDQIFKISKFADLEKITEQFQLGTRWTVRGENGSGKSTLLIKLKEKYPDISFYLPAKNDLLFKSNTSQFSTGETMISIIKEISDEKPGKILLLDEWDANLDIQNTEKISRSLDEINRDFCIIEIRHRFK
ncbi:MAG: hypothetical protein HQK54_06270 [Oligoflexales bacterium]|nr:hypothetical protein [Oligoflexales bacterium]